MMLAIPVILSFLITFLVLPAWIKKARKMNLIWPDMNKYKKNLVSGSGGIVVILGFIIGVFAYVAIKTFYFNDSGDVIEIFVLTSSILILAMIGMMDDFIGWNVGGLRRRHRVLLCFLAAIPLVVINAGHSTISLPLIGRINVGIFYPLLLVPIGIVGAATTFNFLAGYNGLEAGQGVLVLFALSIVALFTNNSWLTLVGLCMVASLIGFWIFNKYPAKVFPGDILTYPVGGLIAIMAILGNFEKIAIFFFTPYIFEFFLKLRGGLTKQSFGKPNRNGGLDMSYDKIYGLEHFSIWLLKKIKRDKRVYEEEVVYLIHFFQIAIIIAGFIIFRRSIF